MRSTFTSEYRDRCSPEMLEKAGHWVESAQGSSAYALFLKKGHSYRKAEFRSHSEKGHEAYDLLLGLDILLRCLGVLALASLEALAAASKDSGEPKNSTRALLSLVSYMHQTAYAFQREILAKSDLSARILARSIAETSDYMLAMLYDQSLIDEYVKSGDDFKLLWSKKLRTKEVTRLRDRALGNFFRSDQKLVLEISTFLSEEFETMSRATHPSYEAGIMFFLRHVR